MIRGGHRFWTAPEGDHSYELDNSPVTWKKLGEAAVEISQPASKAVRRAENLARRNCSRTRSCASSIP